MLPGGGTVIVHRNPAVRTASIELWFRAPSAGFDEQKPGIARLSLAAVAASAPPHGTTLVELIKRDGGALSIAAYNDMVSIGAEVPAWQAPSVLRAMTAAYFTPSITADGLRAATRDSAIVATAHEYDASAILRDALFARLFADGPGHIAPVPEPVAFTRISSVDAQTFATRAFRQSNAIVTIAGNVDQSIESSVRSTIAATPPAPEPQLPWAASAQTADATISAKVGGIGVAWTGPPITDERAATAMDFIGDYLFDPIDGVLARSMSSGADAPFISGNYITLHDPGVLVVTVEGNVPSDARERVLNAALAMGTPLGRDAFAAAKNAFLFHIRQQLATPSGIADNAGWYASEGNAAYAPGDDSGAYLQAAQSLDAGYVASVAAKYLRHPSIVRALTGPANGQSI